MNWSYLLDTLVQILFLVCLAVSLNVLMGYAGQFSMATAAFYGVGAYTYSFMSGKGGGLLPGRILGPGWSFFPSLLVAIAASCVVGMIVSWPAVRRIHGEYVILLTMAFQYVVNETTMTAPRITGGPQGLPVDPIKIGGVAFNTPRSGFIIVLIVTVIIIAFCWLLGKWGFGRLLRGVREDEEVVRSLGKGTAVPKTVAFAMSAGMAGLAGAIAVAYLMFVAPQTYSLDLAILAAAAVALGGPGNVFGVVIAAVGLGAIGPILTNVGMSTESTIPWQYVILGALLVFGIRFRSHGLIPEGKRLFSRKRQTTADAPAEVAISDHSDEVLG